MSRRTTLLGAAATLFSIVATFGATADIYTPSSDSMTNPTIGTAKNGQAAALGTQNLIAAPQPVRPH